MNFNAFNKRLIQLKFKQKCMLSLAAESKPFDKARGLEQSFFKLKMLPTAPAIGMPTAYFSFETD